ncbi:hypothetical protein [Nitratireductor soli]|uniref:hypothetical protein n=1 Tax=Nitratireductor soli TaxID=1670619 RepID=UPI0012F71CA9|nr:hypothetical protein [Nitratireductor soli]
MTRAPMKTNAAQIISALTGRVSPMAKPPLLSNMMDSSGDGVGGKRILCCAAAGLGKNCPEPGCID